MRKILFLLILGCGPQLDPMEVLNHTGRYYHGLRSYQDQFTINVTKLESGTRITYSITGKTYFKQPGRFLIDISKPVEVRIFSTGDSINYLNLNKNSYYRLKKSARPNPQEFTIKEYLKDRVSWTLLPFLFNDPSEVVKGLNLHSFRYPGSRWENGRMVYNLTAEGGEGVEVVLTIDCKTGAIYKVETTSSIQNQRYLQIVEIYRPNPNPDLPDSIFEIKMPVSARREQGKS